MKYRTKEEQNKLKKESKVLLPSAHFMGDKGGSKYGSKTCSSILDNEQLQKIRKIICDYYGPKIKKD